MESNEKNCKVLLLKISSKLNLYLWFTFDYKEFPFLNFRYGSILNMLHDLFVNAKYCLYICSRKETFFVLQAEAMKL